jgi:hypothetical protein
LVDNVPTDLPVATSGSEFAPTATEFTVESTPTPGFSPQELSYVTKAKESLRQYSDASSELGGYLARPGLMVSQDWLAKVSAQMAVLQDTANEIRNLNAPPRFREVQIELELLADDPEEYIDLLAAGIEHFDAGAILASAKSGQSAKEQLDRVNETLADTADQLGIPD